MAELTFKNVRKVFENSVEAVNDFSLNVEDKEFLVIVGPSGCGKSTTLRMVAGLEDITSGELYIGDTYANPLPAKDRDIAMVFQNYALYPHMNVYENMGFGLRLRKFPKHEIERRVNDAARILGLENLLDRRPKALSGGQRQRVALGRAIVRNAKVFLMDEPLSNLDAKLRVQMRGEIVKLHHRIETTTIYVTHDQTEAMTMADRIVVMRDGFIQQVGTPFEIFNRPANLFVAGFIGTPTMNFLDGEITSQGTFKTDDFELVLPDEVFGTLKDQGYTGRTVTLGIRPQDVYDDRDMFDATPENILEYNVEIAELMGSETNITIDVAGREVTARVDARTDVGIGDRIKFIFDLENAHFFDKENEQRIN